MVIPKGIDGLDSGHYWKLKKALYGLKQAGRQWKKCLHEVLIKFGFTRAFANDFLYIKCYKGEIILLVLVYVDDMAVARPNDIHIIPFKSFLSKDFEITDLGELKHILGILISRNRPRCLIFLNQTAYIQRMITHFGMENSSPVSTPLVVKHNLSLFQSPKTEAEKHAYQDYASNVPYLSLVGSLLFTTQTHPNIQSAVRLIAQFGSNLGIVHFEAAKRILCYLKGTTHYNLVLGRQEKDKFDLVRWSDSNWAQDMDDCRSTSSFVFDIAGGSVTWSSKKQSTVATSSVEAKYIASANATKEAVSLRTLLTELDFPPTTATIIHADNQGCIALANNPVSHTRAKHIDIHHYFIQECIVCHEIKLSYVPTKDMLADVFTKALPREAFEKFQALLGVLLLD